MEYRRLGRTDLDVSVICLGTMTWGEQNSEADAHWQLDAALDGGVNFIDTAEMYAVPPRAETQGRTEAYLGTWLKNPAKRSRVAVATKVVGRSQRFPYLRGGQARLDRANIEAAVEASLRRLQVDHIDLYQLHWPDRKTNTFGQLGYRHDPDDDGGAPLEETLEVLGDLVRAGKVRHVGVSNDTPWGVMRMLHLAETRGWPRIASIQNPYNLLNRAFEIGLAEIAIREDIGLLAYSPLAGGVLSGKYEGGLRPPGSRLALFGGHFTRYQSARGQAAASAYVALAREHGLDPAQTAIAYLLSRPFLTSVIIGATTMDQLRANLASAALKLPSSVVEGIEAIHAANPNPCP